MARQSLTWVNIAKPEPGRQYVVLVSYLPLRSYSKIPAFLRHAREVEGQLRTSSGLVGYSLKADVFRKQFLTLSAWESEVALADFVGRKPHSSVMASFRPFMGKTKFVKWSPPGSELPPS